MLTAGARAQIRVPDRGAVYHGKGLRAKVGKRYAIRAGKILTITHGVINGGVILVKDGTIEAVGPADQVAVPEAGYEVIDARREWVMPGFIDLHSHVFAATPFGWGDDVNDIFHQVNPELRTLDTLNPENELVLNARAAGVSAAVFIPGSGTNMSGWGVVVKTAGRTPEEMVVRFPGVIKAAQAGNPERVADLGHTRRGMSWLIRNALERGKAYHARWTAYEKGDSKKKPRRRPDLEYFRSVYSGRVPALIHTQVMQVYQGTMRIFHDQVGVPGFIPSHASLDAFINAPEAAARNMRTDVGPRNFYLDPNTGRCLGLAALWWQGGLRKLTVNTDAPIIPEHELWLQGSIAARFGLDEKTAIEALTIRNAEAIGLADRLGSVEPGKDADLQIRTGSPLEVSAYVRMLLVDGVVVYDVKRDKRRF